MKLLKVKRCYLPKLVLITPNPTTAQVSESVLCKDKQSLTTRIIWDLHKDNCCFFFCESTQKENRTKTKRKKTKETEKRRNQERCGLHSSSLSSLSTLKPQHPNRGAFPQCKEVDSLPSSAFQAKVSQRPLQEGWRPFGTTHF